MGSQGNSVRAYITSRNSWRRYMAQGSSIEWTEATWNPVTGCDKVSPGCKNCYAERMSNRLRAMNNPRYLNGFKSTRSGQGGCWRAEHGTRCQTGVDRWSSGRTIGPPLCKIAGQAALPTAGWSFVFVRAERSPLPARSESRSRDTPMTLSNCFDSLPESNGCLPEGKPDDFPAQPS